MLLTVLHSVKNKKARALNLDAATEERLTLQQRRIFAVNTLRTHALVASGLIHY